MWEQDPSAFYSYEEFQTGVEGPPHLLPAAGPKRPGPAGWNHPPPRRRASKRISSALIDTGSLSLSDLGSMNMGGRGGGFGGRPGGPDARGQAGTQPGPGRRYEGRRQCAGRTGPAGGPAIPRPRPRGGERAAGGSPARTGLTASLGPVWARAFLFGKGIDRVIA